MRITAVVATPTTSRDVCGTTSCGNSRTRSLRPTRSARRSEWHRHQRFTRGEMCKRIAAALILALVLLAQTSMVRAQTAMQFNLPAQPLEAALRAVGAQTNTNVFFDPALVAGRETPALNAQLTLAEALARILAGTGL